MPKIMQMGTLKEREIVKEIKKGAIFIYPCDTIYGLGCNALNEASVRRLREIKQRSDKPFSVISQSKKWILRNFEARKSYVNRLPGPYTFVMRPKKRNLLSDEVTRGNGTVGVRIPDHPFIKVIQKAKVPFVTTSVNFAGQRPATDVSKIPSEIVNSVDYIIGDIVLDNAPSTIIDLTGLIPRIIKRNA